MLNIKRIKQITKSPNFKKYALLFLNGLISSFAFAPTYLFPILFLNFYIILKNLEKSSSKKESFFIGWWFGFGHFITGTYWICNSLLIDPLKFAWLIPFTISLIPAVLAVYIGLTTLCTYILKTRNKLKNRFIIITIFASFWVIFEYLRSILFSGFPWNLIGNIWCFSDIMIQIVSLIGIYGFGFLTIVLFSFFYLLLDKKDIAKNIVIYLIIFLSIFFFGFLRLKNAKVEYIPNVKMRLVQPNIEQTLKWDNKTLMKNLLNQVKLSKSEGYGDITHLVWPESAVPYIIKQDSVLLKELKRFFGDKSLITGGLRADFEQDKIEKIYNSIFIIKNSQILDYYDKVHLVPFGEYIPFRKFLPFVSKITHGSLDFSRGFKHQTIKINDEFSISPMICYEIIFSEKIMDYNNIPDIIINLTNDSWFGNSTGPYQHFDNARLRAVENGLPIVRVANGGISGFIDAYGIVKNKINLNERGYLDFQISQKINIIFYRKNFVIIVIFMFYLIALIKQL